MQYKCSKCKEIKTEKEFSKQDIVRQIPSSYCKLCQKEVNRIFREKNKNNIAKEKKIYVLNLKLDGINAYGGQCVCCGETEPKFLTIDHINGRMGEEKENRSKWVGKRMWAKLKKMGYPKNNYQLLCFNCNCCKGLYGKCPHKSND